MLCNVMHRWSRHDNEMETWRKQLRKSPALAFQDSSPSLPGGPYEVHLLGPDFAIFYLHQSSRYKLLDRCKRRTHYRASCHCLKHWSTHRCFSQ